MIPVKGRISSKFGDRVHPVTKRKSFHNGVDIAAPHGTDIVAPANAKVINIWNHPTGGLSLAIATVDNVRFGFAHLSSTICKVGDVVKMGQVIAKVGNSGLSTGAHLHFTMKINDIFVDPQKYINF